MPLQGVGVEAGCAIITLRMKQFAAVAEGLALIFDLDGVIVDTNPVHTETWQRYLRQNGIQPSVNLPERMFGKRNDDLVRDLFGPGLSTQEIIEHGAAKERLFREIMAGQLEDRLVSGVAAFLEEHKDMPIALASNAEPANVEFMLNGAGIRHYFRVVVDGEQVERPKPAADIFLRAAQLLNVNPENCIVFEDSRTGVDAGLAAGCRVVGLLTTHDSLLGASLEIDSFLSPKLEPWLRKQIPVS